MDYSSRLHAENNDLDRSSRISPAGGDVKLGFSLVVPLLLGYCLYTPASPPHFAALIFGGVLSGKDNRLDDMYLD